MSNKVIKRTTKTIKDEKPKIGDTVRFSVNLIRQGDTTFYALSIPSDVLSLCCYAVNKDEDPLNGFQRVLDEKRAKDIAEYIDSGTGTIPTSVVLSAQPEAEFKTVDRSKTIEFKITEKSFMILDGQHRIYGFSLAKTALRVPVVIYSGLSTSAEARLFIDINTKQKPVPKELLLAINKQAEKAAPDEITLGTIFDIFDQDPTSALQGLLSSAKEQKGAISRVTFYAAVKQLLPLFNGKSTTEIYSILNAYLHAIVSGLHKRGLQHVLTNKTVFRSFMAIFKDVAQRVKDAHSREYSADNFSKVLRPIFSKLKDTTLETPSTSINGLTKTLQDTLKVDFTI